jgi:hypothetical protein
MEWELFYGGETVSPVCLQCVSHDMLTLHVFKLSRCLLRGVLLRVKLPSFWKSPPRW